MIIRPAGPKDADAIWSIVEPTIRAGETYTLPREMDRERAIEYWFSPGHAVFVAEEDGEVLGTYYLRANQKGGGSHVGNCGYMSGPGVRSRSGDCDVRTFAGVRASHGFRAMQFNFVVSSNVGAIHLWEKFGFATVGRLPGAFLHPRFSGMSTLW